MAVSGLGTSAALSTGIPDHLQMGVVTTSISLEPRRAAPEPSIWRRESFMKNLRCGPSHGRCPNLQAISFLSGGFPAPPGETNLSSPNSHEVRSPVSRHQKPNYTTTTAGRRSALPDGRPAVHGEGIQSAGLISAGLRNPRTRRSGTRLSPRGWSLLAQSSAGRSALACSSRQKQTFLPAVPAR